MYILLGQCYTDYTVCVYTLLGQCYTDYTVCMYIMLGQCYSSVLYTIVDVTQGQAETQRHLNTEFLSKVSVEEAAEEDEDLKELQQTLKEAEMEYLSPKTPRKV